MRGRRKSVTARVKVQTSVQIEKHIKSFLQQNGFAEGNHLLLIGVSGGPDSICLLHSMRAITKDADVRLHVAHLNHRLRGADSRADAAYVESFARNLGIPSTIRLTDTLAYKKAHKLTTEQAARKLRYRFFYALAKEMEADAVVLGHTADDQAETVLMHMIRGAGLKGIGGMSPVSSWRLNDRAAPITILRPLLDVSREQTHAYCKQLKLQPRTDKSNLSPEFWRNRIRLTLMPELKKHNPEITDSLLRLASVARESNDFIDIAAQNVLHSISTPSGNGISLRTEHFRQSHRAVQGAAIRLALKDLSGSMEDIGQAHVEAAISLLHSSVGSEANLGNGLKAVRLYDELWMGSGEPPSPWPPLKKSYAIKMPGATQAGPWVVTIERGKADKQSAPLSVSLNKNAVAGKMTLRPWRAGDSIVPLGMKGHKKLQDIFVDEKVPRRWRKNIPILCDADKILWVAGLKVSDEAKITKEAASVITISLTLA